MAASTLEADLSAPYHRCPACHQDVNFIPDRSRQRCPICYAEFPRFDAMPDSPVQAASRSQRLAKFTRVVLLVLFGLPALWLAIAFLGCAFGAGGGGH